MHTFTGRPQASNHPTVIHKALLAELRKQEGQGVLHAPVGPLEGAHHLSSSSSSRVFFCLYLRKAREAYI